MKKEDLKGLIAFPIIVSVGVLVAWAGSQRGSVFDGLPVFAICVGLAFLIQWVVFVPSYLAQTEKFFDLTGSLSYITVMVFAALLSKNIDARSILLMALVLIWAVRLGTFLFRRVHRVGKDGRFDEIKPSFPRFLNVWTVQGLWVTFTAAAALAAITSSIRKEIDIFAIAGAIIWLMGFAIEATADAQKDAFGKNPQNKGKFIHTGLWARSRHPNYFGEILLWLGVAVIALPVLQGWQLLTLISPVFVAILLIKISGIPLLEARADKKWGGQPDYEAYKKNTPALLPKI
jgi:steroid 5-alpha reductase family enzyme